MNPSWLGQNSTFWRPLLPLLVLNLFWTAPSEAITGCSSLSGTLYGPVTLCSCWSCFKKKKKKCLWCGGPKWMYMMLIKGNERQQGLLGGCAWEQRREWAFPCVVLLAGKRPWWCRGHPHAASPEGTLKPGGGAPHPGRQRQQPPRLQSSLPASHRLAWSRCARLQPALCEEGGASALLIFLK